MADRRELCVGGKPISSLRVVDLKVELEKRSLPKSGSKKDLLERLRLHLQLEEDREAALRDEEHVPNLSLCNETENDFIREYLAAQQARFQVQREAKKQYEEKKRESEASAEETTQDEDEASDVSPAKKSPRKAMRPKKKEESTSTPRAQKSSLDFQTPESMPYSTPPQEKRDEDAASHEDDTGEEEEARTPQTRKHKLLKYVQQPTASKGAHVGKSDSGSFSIVEHVDKFQGSGSSDRRDPPPSSLYGEAINLKITSKKETSPVKKEASPAKKEISPVKKESPPAKKDERPVRGQKTQSVKSSPAEIPETEQVFPRLVDVWSEKEREQEAAAEKLVQSPKKLEQNLVQPTVIQSSSTHEQEKPIKHQEAKASEPPVSANKVPSTIDLVKEKPVKVEKSPEKSKVETTHVNVEEVVAPSTVKIIPEKVQTEVAKIEKMESTEVEQPIHNTSTSEALQTIVESDPIIPKTETTKETSSPAIIEEKKVDLVPVEEKIISSEIPTKNITKLEPEKMDQTETKKDTEVIIETKPQEDTTSPPDEVVAMAVDNERPPLSKSEVTENPVVKIATISQVEEPSEDNEEDELQMDTTETIDDSLKLTTGESEGVADNHEQQTHERSRSSSRSDSPDRSSPEERSRNGRSSSPQDNEQKQDITSQQNEIVKGETVRKWKIRKQVSSVETNAGDGEAPRKRRWGTSQLLPTKKPALVISTDSLKSLVPDAKPLSAEEVRLGSPNFQSSVKPTVSSSHEGDDELPAEKVEKVEVVRRVAVEVAAEAFAPAKPEVVLAAAAPLMEATSPAQQPRACVLSVSNLVRPFTINQLKELLARTGHLVDGKFWIDKVKSSCLVQYGTEEEAEETRAALHGIHWPTSNPKMLLVDYSTTEELENRLSGKETTNPPVAKVEPTVRAAAAAVQSIESKRDKAEKVREWDLGKTGEPTSEKDQITKENRPTGEGEDEVKVKDETPAKLLDDLFRKTKATPHIYWLPLTASQIAEKEEMRRQRLAERETRLREVQQRRDEELQQRQREREKQRETERERQRARDRDREKERERDRDRQRSRKRSRSSSSSSSSSTSSSPNKKRKSKTPPRKR